MRKLTLLLLVTLFASPVVSGQSHTPGNGGPDPANIGAPTAPTAPPAGAPMLPFHFGPRPAPPLGQKFGNVAAVAFTPEGHLLVFNRNAQIEMVEYDATGTNVLRVFNPNLAINPHALRIDRHGNIWATDSYWNVLWKLNAKGEVLMMLGKRGENGAWDDAAWNGMFNQPLDVAFDPDDNFYVVQGHGGTSPPEDCSFCTTYPYAARPDRHAVAAKPPVVQGSDPRIMKFDKTGRFVTSASLAHPTGPFATTHTVVISPAGEVWIGDRNAKKLIVFDRNLKRLREIQESYLTCGLFVDAQGGLWMSAGMEGMVFKLDWNGKILGWFGKWGNTPDSNDIGEAHQLVVSKDLKTIYVADSVNAHVLKIESDVAMAPPKPAAASWTPTRTPDGHPDLQGIWTMHTFTPLVRPARYVDQEFLTEEEATTLATLLTQDEVDPLVAGIFGASDEERRKRVVQNDPTHYDNALWLANPDLKPLSSNRTSLIYDPPDGKIPPVTPDAIQRAAARRAAAGFDSYENRPLQERCIIWAHEGPPMLPPPYNDVLQIVQTPGYVLVIREVETAPRLIPIDGRPHVSDNIRRWTGDSRGRWEGDTLVVDTTNFTHKTAFQGSSAALHVVERFTRVSAETILYRFTVDDSDTWTRPWSAEIPLTTTKGPLYEYACHEGNYGMPDILRGARFTEKEAAREPRR